MIKNIFIKNYALIEELDINFDSGFTVITGETGAGKSILLGALGLILGKRADTAVLNDKNTKCIVEVNFDIEKYNIKSFFDSNKVDYQPITSIRREIAPAGKSRAFINDTPVNLNQIQELSEQLVDIHSQHENLNLNDLNFQLKVLDAFADTEKELSSYKTIYAEYKKIERKLSELKLISEQEKSEFDYLQFRFDELENAKLTEGEQETAEEEYKTLTHAEEIQKNLATVNQNISHEETGILKKLKESITALANIEKYHEKSKELKNRLETVKIELHDLAPEIETYAHDIEYNPEHILLLETRLNQIYSLQKKHSAENISQLIDIKNNIKTALDKINSYDNILKETEKQLETLKEKLSLAAVNLSQKRQKSVNKLESEIENLIHELGIPGGKFTAEITPNIGFKPSGKDLLRFLFSANKNIEPQEISKIASGGEISRLMLSIKAIIADSISLPAIIFDEIDTGISGEIADKTANIMLRMSKNMQVIDITHLPQVAAKAHNHFFVYKEENENKIQTKIKHLTKNERIEETAKMLSGEKITEASLKNAMELLKFH